MSGKTFGNYLADLRREKNLTQKEVADRLYVSDKTVSRWETDRSLPELSLIPAIAELFGVSADELLRSGLDRAEEEVEDTGSKAMAENVASLSYRRFCKYGLIAVIAFFMLPLAGTVVIRLLSSKDRMADAWLITFAVGIIFCTVSSVIFLVVYYIRQSRRIRDCGASENVRRTYQESLRDRLAVYVGIVGGVVLFLTGLLLAAIGVFAVVLIAERVLRVKRV
ncbi:MAG: helix-turn-helix transcriptional regulator [Lachnospiraceae bacterium]|nr:helix-turn-helix transcriptional regulator [Lachnospiraceae bacterium]